MKKKLLIPLMITSLCMAMIPSGAMAFSYKVQQAKVISGVNFREEPSTAGKQIRTLSTGESLTLLDKPNNYWLHVQDKNGKQGYVSSSFTYIQLNTVTVTPPTNGTIVASVSFRS